MSDRPVQIPWVSYVVDATERCSHLERGSGVHICKYMHIFRLSMFSAWAPLDVLSEIVIPPVGDNIRLQLGDMCSLDECMRTSDLWNT
jgi:hypothetical protein